MSPGQIVMAQSPTNASPLPSETDLGNPDIAIASNVDNKGSETDSTLSEPVESSGIVSDVSDAGDEEEADDSEDISDNDGDTGGEGDAADALMAFLIAAGAQADTDAEANVGEAVEEPADVSEIPQIFETFQDVNVEMEEKNNVNEQ